MDARAIDEKAKSLQKADKAGEAPSVLLGLLNDLKTGVKATEEILRSTKIGVTVNKFRQNKNGEVARAAGDLVKQWREQVEKEKSKKGAANGRKPSSQGGAATPQSGTASPAPAVKAKTESTVAPDKRTWKADKVDIYRTDSKARDACIGLMYDGLVFMSTTPATTVLSIAMSVEEAAYKNLQPETSSAYKDKMRMLFQNLKNKANPALRARVLHGEITPEKLVNMSHDDLKSKEHKAEDEKILKEEMDKAQTAAATQTLSTSLLCGKCKQKKVSYTQAQTRSADEPMTTFCHCTVCGNRWKLLSLVMAIARTVEARLQACCALAAKAP